MASGRQRLLLPLCLTLGFLLAACAPPARQPETSGRAVVPAGKRPDWHVVRSGETLYSIARRYGLDVASLARWNQLGDGSLIRVGQRLRLKPSSATDTRQPPEPRVPAPAWRWPADGPVIRAFGATGATRSGIHIGGRQGQPVRAAADGTVVYSGSGLVGYGELVIIKHNESWLTAYGYNAELLVREGDRVTAGQTIARMGQGPGREPALHFEIRLNGTPVDPGRQLPPRR